MQVRQNSILWKHRIYSSLHRHKLLVSFGGLSAAANSLGHTSSIAALWLKTAEVIRLLPLWRSQTSCLSRLYKCKFNSEDTKRVQSKWIWQSPFRRRPRGLLTSTACVQWPRLSSDLQAPSSPWVKNAYYISNGWKKIKLKKLFCSS